MQAIEKGPGAVAKRIERRWLWRAVGRLIWKGDEMNAATWITAVATIVLAVLTGVYVYQNRSIVRSVALQAQEQRRASRASLLSQILEEYGSPEMGEAIRKVAEWRGFGGDNFAEQFEKALRQGRQNTDYQSAHGLDHGPRRTLSQYFSRLRVLAESELLETHLVAAALGRQPIAFFLEVVDPLDQAARRSRGWDASRKTRIFFEQLQHDHMFEE